MWLRSLSANHRDLREIGALSNGVLFRTDPLQKKKGQNFLSLNAETLAQDFEDRSNERAERERKSLLDFQFFFFSFQ